MRIWNQRYHKTFDKIVHFLVTYFWMKLTLKFLFSFLVEEENLSTYEGLGEEYIPKVSRIVDNLRKHYPRLDKYLSIQDTRKYTETLSKVRYMARVSRIVDIRNCPVSRFDINLVLYPGWILILSCIQVGY